MFHNLICIRVRHHRPLFKRRAFQTKRNFLTRFASTACFPLTRTVFASLEVLQGRKPNDVYIYLYNIIQRESLIDIDERDVSVYMHKFEKKNISSLKTLIKMFYCVYDLSNMYKYITLNVLQKHLRIILYPIK